MEVRDQACDSKKIIQPQFAILVHSVAHYEIKQLYINSPSGSIMAVFL